MRKIWTTHPGIAVILACGVALAATVIRMETSSPAVRAAEDRSGLVPLDANDIGGIVASSEGPEAGVWVIAETTDLPTRLRKIVVTDGSGRYLLPQLPKATYKVWVRGYGLVRRWH
jgi:hypothetical protein